MGEYIREHLIRLWLRPSMAATSNIKSPHLSLGDLGDLGSYIHICSFSFLNHMLLPRWFYFYVCPSVFLETQSLILIISVNDQESCDRRRHETLIPASNHVICFSEEFLLCQLRTSFFKAVKRREIFVPRKQPLSFKLSNQLHLLFSTNIHKSWQ